MVFARLQTPPGPSYKPTVALNLAASLQKVHVRTMKKTHVLSVPDTCEARVRGTAMLTFKRATNLIIGCVGA